MGIGQAGGKRGVGSRESDLDQARAADRTDMQL